MLAYLINPKLQRAHDIELPDDTRAMLSQMHKLIGADTLDHMMISDERDQLWCDDGVFSRGLSCFAFRIRGANVDMGPFGGTCIIIGNDRNGRARAPYVPLAMLSNDLDWLGEIVPEVTWVEEVDRLGRTRISAHVTYTRPS